MKKLIHSVIWSLTGFTVICITVLACSSPDFNSGKFVFGQFINQTGCKFPRTGCKDDADVLGPDGIAWLLGVCYSHVREDTF